MDFVPPKLYCVLSIEFFQKLVRLISASEHSKTKEEQKEQFDLEKNREIMDPLKGKL